MKFVFEKLENIVGKGENVTQKLNFVFETLENIVGKGENAGFQHFLLFSQCFQTASFPG